MLCGDKAFLSPLEMTEFVGNAALEVEMPLVVTILASCMLPPIIDLVFIFREIEANPWARGRGSIVFWHW